jgi:antitoxin component YwqK of YwqJK toxin-antitoxin module
MLLISTLQLFSQTPPNGKYLEKHENGKMKVKGRYKNGQKKGNWFYYSSNGQPEKREFWKNGALKITYLYNEKGRIYQTIDKKGTHIIERCNCR